MSVAVLWVVWMVGGWNSVVSPYRRLFGASVLRPVATHVARVHLSPCGCTLRIFVGGKSLE
jgi:hypothetical protein